MNQDALRPKGWLTSPNHWSVTKKKKCYGPLHSIEGELLPCDSDDPDKSAFWFFGPGTKREGAPLSRCKRCMRLEKGRDPDSERVPIEKVYRLMTVLIDRIGKAEMARRCKLSPNFWPRIKGGTYNNVQRAQYDRIKAVHDQVVSSGERRHPDDIHHGPEARGKEEPRRYFHPRKKTLYDFNFGEGYQAYLAYIAERNEVTTTPPDSYWWHHTGMEWLPRWGEEMLGENF